MNAQFLIDHLGLVPHPEGGFFREVYRCGENIPADALSSKYSGARSVSTAIYFLLTGETFSSFHRLRSDEIWHFYAGDPVKIHLIKPDGNYEQKVVGVDVSTGQRPMVVIPADCWFGARVENPDGYTLMGCTVAPGFDFSDFELAQRDELVKQFPQHQPIITALTRIL